MPVNDTYLDVTVTQLEMSRPENPVPVRAPVMHHALTFQRLRDPTASFYRYLYETVGEPWLWYERRNTDDESLTAIIRDDNIAVLCLYYGGVPAGFAEVDARIIGSKPHDATLLAYFGLVPDFIGCGLGRFFLDATIHLAWDVFPADRLIVRTCTLDHPAALPLYQKSGFLPTGQQTTRIPDPRRNGLLPPDAGPEKILGRDGSGLT
jgi:GNAT superfamily N-acetyltransferase